MSRTVGSLERSQVALRETNVIDCVMRLRDGGPATISELAAETRMSRPTVEAIIGDLEARGLVAVDSIITAPGGKAGRPAKQYRFRGESGLVAGLEITGTRLAIVVSDLSGRITLAATVPLDQADAGSEWLPAIRAAVDTALTRVGVMRGGLLAAGVALHSPLSFADGPRRFEGEVTGDDRVLRARLDAVIGAPVVLDVAVHMAALGEDFLGAGRLSERSVLLTQPADPVAGVVVRGEVYRGHQLSSGRGLRPAEVAAKVALMTTPSVVILTEEDGWAAEELRAELAARVPEGTVPELVTAELGGYAGALGALVSALRGATTKLLREHEALARERPSVSCPRLHLPAQREGAAIDHLFPLLPGEGAAGNSRGRGAFSMRIGVIGVGARAVLATWVNSVESGAKVVAVADPSPKAAERTRKLFGKGVTVFPDHHKLLSDGPGLDAVFVLTPDHTHAAITQDCLNAGVPVYLEKPMAITVEDCDAILATAHRTGTKLYIGHNMRHMAFIRQMRELIEAGHIGEVQAIWCRHFVGHGGDFYFKDWHADRRFSGSLLLQKGAHDIDAIHYLSGGTTTRVVASGALKVYGEVSSRKDNSGLGMEDWFDLASWPPREQRDLNPVIDVEDISMMQMNLDNGVLASYQQCHFTPDYWRNYTVIGDAGRLENFGDGDGGLIRVWDRRSSYNPDGDYVYRIDGDHDGHDDADQFTVGEFLSFVARGERTATSPVAARNAVAAGLAAAASLRDGSTPQAIPPIRAELAAYFAANQQVSHV